MLYPIRTPLHWLPLQYPKTPRSTFSKVPRGMLLIIGVDSTERSRRTKAAKRRMVSGVAGLRSIAMAECA